jgi:tetratricopeptide (TPR) repeat protein
MAEEARPQRWSPRNPLGVIALFVFLIESIATVSLRTVADTPLAMVLVWFIVGFPLYISIVFFLILWFRRLILFAPEDFPNPEDFAALFREEFARLSQKVTHIEAKQELSEIGPQTPDDDVIRTVGKLLAVGDPWAAIKAAQKLLEQGEYRKCLEILQHIRVRVGDTHPSFPRLLANIAFSQIGLGQYETAIQHLLAFEKMPREKRNFSPRHAVALAYAYSQLGNPGGYQHWMDIARELGPDAQEIESLAERYREIARDIQMLRAIPAPDL